ncbi:MAG TPA: formate dehydrogenase accessory protein FdhE [Candidatus Acidoferrum sp.]|nr:formate dehydrogenase accessory protein FdhE [Candidatus Acidoferrum sp.]
MSASPYEARIRRAVLLETDYPFAAEVLNFYGHLTRFQRELYQQLAKDERVGASRFAGEALRERIDPEALLPNFGALLSLVEAHAPAPLARCASELKNDSEQSQRALLVEYAEEGGRGGEALDARAELLARAVTQPFAEILAERTERPPILSLHCACPLCGGLPVVGVLRPEGDGGKRFLVCGFCSNEWEFRRILCAGCAEEREHQLPVFVAEQLPHLRVEACDTCRRYIRTVDLTKDGNAVPLVDDLAGIPLTLWAAEHGYSRLAANLLGT